LLRSPTKGRLRLKGIIYGYRLRFNIGSSFDSSFGF
jgi:hypothetical protein